MNTKETADRINLKTQFDRAVKGLKNQIKFSKKLQEKLYPEEEEETKTLHTRRVVEAESLGKFFGNLEGSPCKDCGDCCRFGVVAGYYNHHDFHPDIISGKVDLLSMVVPLAEEENSKRCIFLKPGGCNIPNKYRSTTCLSYYCQPIKPIVLKIKGSKERLWNFSKTDRRLNTISNVAYFRKQDTPA